MTSRPSVRFIVPTGVDDPRRVSGGNVYDRHVRDGLRRAGWAVATVEVADGAAAASALRATPDDALVLVDGLAAAWAPAAVEEAAPRRRLVLLAHMVAAAFADAAPTAVDAERRVLEAAGSVIVTSRWTADEFARRGLTVGRVTVAAPGASAAGATPHRGHRDLLCVGVIAPHKGQDTLLAALAQLAAEDWTCTIVGSPEPYSDFAAEIARSAASFGGRVRLTGVLGGSELDDEYRCSALLVAPSRVESSGMAIVDARARGVPVVAAETGGIPDALRGGGGILVRPGDPTALAGALEEWMSDPDLRSRLRREALAARATLPTWPDTVARVARALEAA